MLALLVATGTFSALFSVIDDCDEVYNYWEPVHLLLYGSGFQTWEYSPAFALRSYWYPGVMALLGWPLKLLLPSKLWVFYGLRLLLGLFYAWCASFFYVSARVCIDVPEVRALFAVSLIALPGFFAASTALLPNSFTMCVLMVSYGCWLRGFRSLAVIAGAMAAWLGVPFAALMLVPMGVKLLLDEGLVPVAVWGAIGTVVSVVPQLIVDRYCYGKWVFAAVNIVFYNALSGETDSTLYGVEPYTFYINNLVLNGNIVFVLGMWGLADAAYEMIWARRPLRAWVIMSATVWGAFMFAMPHKEQRFLYPIYPLLALSAAVSVCRYVSDFPLLSRRAKTVAWLLVAVCVVLSASRLAAQHKYRSGTISVWHSVQHERNKTICVGVDWYRFPSSFWLPADNVKLEFVRSSFKGLLPKHYAEGRLATSAVPSGMNNRNREESDRFVPLSRCDFVVQEEGGKNAIVGEVAASAPIVDSGARRTLFRAFYVPLLSERAVPTRQYQMVRVGNTSQA